MVKGEWKDESTEKFRELTGGELTMTVIDTCSKGLFSVCCMWPVTILT